MFSSGPTPPLSPILLGGLAARPLSPKLLQPALNTAMTTLSRRHPGLFERLSDLGTPVYLIDPVDLPLAFILTADGEHPTLRAARDGEGSSAIATIRGPMLDLLRLLEGKIDGDALFFSRSLVIEGDTEAVVALRNCVDGLEIDLMAEVTASFGPFAGPVRKVAQFGQGLFSRMADDLSILHRVLIAPTQRRVDAQGAKLRTLEEKINNAPKERSRGRSGARQRSVRT
ncbi:MAG: SCP2 sterol-binding domain-containing protein [Magnetovibrio sp.]|nr:SCP2 sterol-binding domain-containing protein [Magnetovibrio sp.]